MRTNKSQKESTILTNDPSICAWGYAVISMDEEILEANCIKTESGGKKMRIRKGDDSIRRINEITSELIRVIKEHNVVFIISELPHGSQSASAAVMIGMVTGIMQTIADCFDIGIEWYSEGDSKHSLLGKRSATKGETIKAVKKLYDVPWFNVGYRDEAIADAMSIYYLARKSSGTLKALLK